MPGALEDGGEEVVGEEDGVHREDRQAVERREERDGERDGAPLVRGPVEVARGVDVVAEHGRRREAEQRVPGWGWGQG